MPTPVRVFATLGGLLVLPACIDVQLAPMKDDDGRSLDGADSADTGSPSEDTGDSSRPPDTSGDTAGETGQDTGVDSATDTSADTGVDTSSDSAGDTGVDSGSDTSVDSGAPSEPAETLAGEVDAVFADLAVSPDGAYLYATRVFHDDLVVLDTRDLHVVATIPVGGGPEAVRLTVDGRQALVAVNTSPGRLVFVDVDPTSGTAYSARASVSLSDNGSLGVGVHPGGALAAALTQRPDPGTIALVDISTRTVTGRVAPRAGGSAPLLNDAVFTGDGLKGYVSVFQSDGASNVVVWDPLAEVVTGAIDLGLPHAGGGPGTMVVVGPPGSESLWVANNSWSADGLTVVDTTSDSVLTHLDLGTGDGNIPGLCGRADGSRVIVAAGYRPLVAYDTTTLAAAEERVERTTHHDCIVSPLDDFVYVSTTSGEILKVDLRTFSTVGTP